MDSWINIMTMHKLGILTNLQILTLIVRRDEIKGLCKQLLQLVDPFQDAIETFWKVVLWFGA